MKKILCIFLSLTLCFSLAATAFALDNTGSSANKVPNYELNTTSDVSNVYLSNIGDSNIAFTNLFDSFRTNEINMSDSGYSVSGVYSSQFPTYYAGSYINTDGELIVLLVDSLTEAEQAAAKADVCQRAESYNIIFGTAENSYSSLVDAMTQISNYMDTGATQMSTAEISSARINDYQNIVVAGVATDTTAYSPNAEESLDSIITSQNDPIFSSSLIVFEEDDSKVMTDASINCGDGINYSSGSTTTNFSAGFRASYTDSSGNEIKGFITCGHAFYGRISTVTIKTSSSVLGTLDTSRNMFSGKIDAAFIRLSSSSSISNKVVTTNGDTFNISTNMIHGPAMGSIVYMYGASSAASFGNVRQGVITSLSAKVTATTDDYSISLTDLYETDYTALSGDSGGIVFSLASTGEFAASGVHHGHNSTHSYCTKALNISAQFDVFVY